VGRAKSFMNLDERIEGFEKLGKYLGAIDEGELLSLADRARQQNSWFTEESVRLALKGLQTYLDGANLREWVNRYKIQPANKAKTIAIVMAGNVPLVGFHDFLSVLVSGNKVLIKLSSRDSVLLPYLSKKLVEFEPRFEPLIEFAEQLKNFDAVIATGSDNSSRYFQFYFGKYPHIIRKNRTSCAVLNGKESPEEIEALARDVFSYFGLGCRNVSKLFIPQNFDLVALLDCWKGCAEIMNHHKYHNNYDYQKSILLINRREFLDTGFVMLQENEKLVSPISVLYYERYRDEGELALKLTENRDKIQCVVGKSIPGSVPFGQAQNPRLWDYADQIDTLKFLWEFN
jgi:hypothetical protein